LALYLMLYSLPYAPRGDLDIVVVGDIEMETPLLEVFSGGSTFSVPGLTRTSRPRYAMEKEAVLYWYTRGCGTSNKTTTCIHMMLYLKRLCIISLSFHEITRLLYTIFATIYSCTLCLNQALGLRVCNIIDHSHVRSRVRSHVRYHS